jgi:hypothetical protein
VELRADVTIARGRVSVEADTADEPVARILDPEPSPAGPPIHDTAVLGPTLQSDEKLVSAASGPWLELPDGQRAALVGPIVRIGRALDNDIVLDDPSVSRYHGQVTLGPRGCLLADLGSTNGTRVDSEPVAERVLRPGDLIHLGAVPLRFHAPD